MKPMYAIVLFTDSSRHWILSIDYDLVFSKQISITILLKTWRSYEQDLHKYMAIRMEQEGTVMIWIYPDAQLQNFFWLPLSARL